MTEPSFAFMLSHTRLVLTVSAFVQVLIYSEFFYIVLRPYLCPARAELAKADQTGAEEIGAGVDPEVGGATVNGTQDVVKTIAQQQQQPATSMEPTGKKLQDCSSSGSGYLVNAMAHGATTDVEAGQEKFDRGVRIGERWYGRRITPGLERTIHDDATPPTSATAAQEQQQVAAPVMDTNEATSPHTTAGDVVQPLIRSISPAPQDAHDAERDDNDMRTEGIGFEQIPLHAPSVTVVPRSSCENPRAPVLRSSNTSTHTLRTYAS
eukprot:CAMPEP_0198115280 /NCGR_PEP_ID=MMETSP1442-20131203/6439_1 /TAXON_ID= /ORGANISM="Craspedostauros australis, Strain CCMP3328" /LENGTH=264 /DNA_ID=CAMNT_0043772769 /DNA_START=154 /DNA_END=950 /DNA_ORIENTATION=-